jgi:uncharacterized protein YfkK (UPF0435 family)
MITEYGMSDALGPLTYGAKQEQVFLGRDFAQNRDYSESVAEAIDKEARLLMNDCYHDAENILEHNIEVLHALAKSLMEKETLSADEVRAIFDAAGLKKPEPHWGELEKKWADEDEIERKLRGETAAGDMTETEDQTEEAGHPDDVGPIDGDDRIGETDKADDKGKTAAAEA